jgi:hypothetical protein
MVALATFLNKKSDTPKFIKAINESYNNVESSLKTNFLRMIICNKLCEEAHKSVEEYGLDKVKDMETFKEGLQKFSKINEEELKDKLIDVQCQNIESVETEKSTFDLINSTLL